LPGVFIGILTTMQTPAGWTETEKGLVREYTFDDFSAAIRFINGVAHVATELNHHPEIVNSYNKVALTLFTHDANAITEKDYALALEINNL